MKNFVAEIPGKIVFGTGCVDTVGEYAAHFGKPGDSSDVHRKYPQFFRRYLCPVREDESDS